MASKRLFPRIPPDRLARHKVKWMQPLFLWGQLVQNRQRAVTLSTLKLLARPEAGGATVDGSQNDAAAQFLDDAMIEHARNNIKRTKLVGADDGGNRLGLGQLGRFIDTGGTAVERAAEYAGKTEHIVDWFG